MKSIDRRTFLAAAGLGAIGARNFVRAEPPKEAADETAPDQFRERFLRHCDAAAEIVDCKKLFPRPQHLTPFYIDSYAVRGLAVAYDLTNKREYLDVCRRWALRMAEYQDKMDPAGAYYMNYGRAPGESKGYWYVADASCVALAVEAVAVRCPDAAEKRRLHDSVLAFHKLVSENYVRPSGGVCNGLWPNYADEWWCSSATFAALCFQLHARTGEQPFLTTAAGAVDWLNRGGFKSVEFHDKQQHMKELMPTVLMYFFEPYSAGMKHLQGNAERWKASLVEIDRARKWMDEHRANRDNYKWSLDSQWGSKLGGLPFHLYVWSRLMPDGQALSAAADADLERVLKAIDNNLEKHWQLSAFAALSLAEKALPGAVHRAKAT